MLLLKRAVDVGGDSPATITVGQPLAPCRPGPGGPGEDLPDRRLAHGRRGPAGGVIAAARISSPLRRMAGVAGAVDAGDSIRPDARGGAPRGGAARRVVQPHARPAGGCVRPTAWVRLRRVARAANAADRHSGPDRGPGRSKSPSREEVDATVAEVSREIARMDRLVEDLTLLASSDEGIAYRAAFIELRPFIADTAGERGAGRRAAGGARSGATGAPDGRRGPACPGAAESPPQRNRAHRCAWRGAGFGERQSRPRSDHCGR